MYIFSNYKIPKIMNTPLTQKSKYNNNIAITSQNANLQLYRSDKHFLNPRNKTQLTSSEVFKSSKPKQFVFQSKHNVTSYSSSVKNTEESTSSMNNKVPFTTKQTRLKTLVYVSQKHFNTELHLNKVNNIMNSNKIKQVSIDLQRKYNKKKTSFPKKKKESCDICFHINTNTNNNTNEFGYVNQIQQHEDTTNALVNPSMKKHNSCNYYGNVVKRSLSKPMLNVHRVKDSHSNTKHKHKENNVIKFQFKPRSNTYYIKSNNYIHSNNNNNNKTFNNTNSTTPQQSQVFSSISTVQTLFKANEVEPTKQVSSKDQITSIEELKTKLNIMNPNTNNNNNIQFNMNSNCISHTHHNTKCNIINAEMLDNSTNTNIINEDIYISSHNRIQKYKLLLDCISNKFSEIQSIVHDDGINTKLIYINDNNTNTNTNNKLSELHSKIEFTQDNILKQTTKQPKANPYDIDDDEMEEKTNTIIPQGRNSKTEPNDIGKIDNNNNEKVDINYNSFIQCYLKSHNNNNNCNNHMIIEPTLSMNSDLIKTFLEVNCEGINSNNNNENIVSFLSNYQNEIKSFLQSSCNNNNNATDNSDGIINNNTNDTMTTIIQSSHSTYNKIDSNVQNNFENKEDYVNDNSNNNNKCLLF